MEKTIFPAAIKSRPVYGVLKPAVGAKHLAIADGEGAEAIIDLVQTAGDSAADLLANMHIIYCTSSNGTNKSADLEKLGAAQFYHAPSIPAMLPRLIRVLVDAQMGTQFYVSGTESLIGQAEREIMNTGFPFASIQKEHRGSTCRRVQCVHCKGITEDVATDPYVCSHCGLNLFVRDHYSRRLAAFQGVNIDAEDPGLVPPQIMRFK